MTYFQAYILHCHGPTGFALGKVKEILSRYKSKGIMAQKYYFNSSSPSPSSCFGYI